MAHFYLFTNMDDESGHALGVWVTRPVWTSLKFCCAYTHTYWNMCVGVCCENYIWTVLPSLCLEMEVADLHVLANVWGLDREES